MAIVYQAGDALLYTARSALLGQSWGNHVYIDEAPTTITSTANVWLVLRLLSDVPAGNRGDRDERSLRLRVNCVSENKDMAWTASAKAYSLLHNSGTQDRTATSVGSHSEWYFLTVSAERQFNLTPNKEYGVQFFEAGYEFNVVMEAKNGYS